MKAAYRHTYIKWKNLISGLYLPAKDSDINQKVAVILAKGAFSCGDMGKNEAYAVLAPLGIPLFVPDYYGHFRSGGKFTPENCARTILDCADIALGKREIYDYSMQKEKAYNFDEIIIVGSSFGGWIPWYINNFFSSKKIGRIGLIAPFIDFHRMAGKFPEEDTREFLKKGEIIFRNAYRGIESGIWKSFLFAKNKNFDPMRNLDALSDSQVAIVHGKKDDVINFGRSEILYDSLKNKNPDGKYSLKLMENTGHTDDKFDKKMRFILDKLLTLDEKRR
jgi:esterase/lipase